MTRMAIVIEFETEADPTVVRRSLFEGAKKVFDQNNRFGIPESGVHMYATLGTLANAVMTPIELHEELVPRE